MHLQATMPVKSDGYTLEQLAAATRGNLGSVTHLAECRKLSLRPVNSSISEWGPAPAAVISFPLWLASLSEDQMADDWTSDQYAIATEAVQKYLELGSVELWAVLCAQTPSTNPQDRWMQFLRTASPEKVEEVRSKLNEVNNDVSDQAESDRLVSKVFDDYGLPAETELPDIFRLATSNKSIVWMLEEAELDVLFDLSTDLPKAMVDWALNSSVAALTVHEKLMLDIITVRRRLDGKRHMEELKKVNLTSQVTYPPAFSRLPTEVLNELDGKFKSSISELAHSVLRTSSTVSIEFSDVSAKALSALRDLPVGTFSEPIKIEFSDGRQVIGEFGVYDGAGIIADFLAVRLKLKG